MARAMKNSGIDWLGDIPAEWEIGRIGQLYSERREKVSDVDFPPLSVTMRGILPQLSSAAKSDAHDDRKLVRKGDFAINSRSDRRGSCGTSLFDGSVSLINIILTPREGIHPVYYDWLFHSTMFADEFYKWGHGIVDDLWTTNWQDMKKISVPVPPLDEQQRIAAFLDRECARIDSVVEKTRASIEEYRKLKQAIITRAVTRGIRANRTLKHSGIEWLGDIPADWNVINIRKLFSFGKGLTITKEDLRESGQPVVSYGQIHSKFNSGTTLTPELIRFADNDYLQSNPQSLVKRGDFIFADTSEDLEGCGNCVYVDNDSPIFAGYHTIILRSKTCADLKYFAFLFLSDAWRKQIRERVTGVKLFSISQKILRATSVLVPPLDEQREIAAYLDEKTSAIDSLVAKKNQLVAELERLKKSLIFEYVTGKKEVAQWTTT